MALQQHLSSQETFIWNWERRIVVIVLQNKPTWDIQHEGFLISSVLVFNDNPVFALISGLDFGDGKHDHVVVVAVADKLVTTAFLANGGTLIRYLKIH